LRIAIKSYFESESDVEATPGLAIVCATMHSCIYVHGVASTT